jgi:hypothetical protein
MKRLLCVLLALALPAAAQNYEREKRWAAEVVPNLVVGDALRLKLPGGRDFLGITTEAQTKPARGAVLLVHGMGVHPDFGVIGALRVSLADAGYATLSIQMPVLRADARAEDYLPALLPETLWRIRAGARWLEERGHLKSFLLCHSVGCRMANAYYEETAEAPFAAWVVLGITSPFGRLGNVKVPVFDVFGEMDFPAVLRDDWRRRLALNAIPGSRQETIAGADHYYTGRERELAAAIRKFLAQVP